MNYCKCGKEAYISVANLGDYCCDCHNTWVREQYGIKAEFEYPKEFEIIDKKADKNRTFQLQYLNLGHCISWIAKEIPSGYEVNHISYPYDNPVVVVEDFINKIIDAVEAKTLDNNNSLKMKGNITITWDEESDCTGMVIDGKEVSPFEFAEMITSYEGWQIQYRIVYPTECVLKKDELFLPVKVGYNVLLEELERNVNIISGGNNFIENSSALVFETLFSSIFQKLELMKNSEDYSSEVFRTVKAIIERLKSIGTNDDYFPDNLINQLNHLIGKEEVN